jgi:hypothetical protein
MSVSIKTGVVLLLFQPILTACETPAEPITTPALSVKNNST